MSGAMALGEGTLLCSLEDKIAEALFKRKHREQLVQ